MIALFLLQACTGGSDGPPPAAAVPAPAPVTFGPLVPHPAGDGVVASVREASIDGRTVQLGFHPLMTTGERYGGAVFGELRDAAGQPMPWPAGAPASDAPHRLCNVADFGSLLVAAGGLFHVAQLECALGGLVVTPLTQDADGRLTPGAPRPADLSGVRGGSTFCSGDVTPWGTHLAGEEYEADARKALPNGHLPATEMDRKTKHPWEWSFHNDHLATHDDIHPYDFGWMAELRVVGPDGEAEVAKHYAMGRFSHELGQVMPDRRTVYLTDDQYHGAFFLFVADAPDDLTAGTLYAARWRQRTAAGAAALDWVSLGHATNAEVDAAIAARTSFDALFDSAPVGGDGACPVGFGRTTTTWGTECLAAREPLLASRLESRRTAGLRGATTEFTKSEGMGVDVADRPGDTVLYVAMSKIDVGMLEEQTDDRGPGDYRRPPGNDHIRMEKNPCGVVFAMAVGEPLDTDGEAIASDYVVRAATPAVVGRPVDDRCAEDGIANPDNLTFADDLGLLVIAEDTGRHAHDTLWAVDMRNGGPLMPLMQVDGDSEVSGMHWFGDIGGHAYLTVSNQWDQRDWPDRRTVVGVLGPFPVR